MLLRLLMLILFTASVTACASVKPMTQILETPQTQKEISMPQLPATETVPMIIPTLQLKAMGDLKLTILYDSTITDSRLTPDWGFAVLVEYGSHTLLFDTGTNGSILLENMRQLNVDPKSIEAVILSHEHDDHIGGLKGLLEAGFRPKVYAPAAFGDSFKQMVRNQTELVEVTDALEIIPGVHTTRPVGSIIELALVLETRDGSVVITGCAHPGVAEMIRQAQAVVSGKIALLVGGFHLYQTSKDELPSIISEVHQLGVDKVLPAHCTGEEATALFRTEYGENFIEGGVGRTVTLPL